MQEAMHKGQNRPNDESECFYDKVGFHLPHSSYS
jgi:hypothetical protein